MKTLLDERYVEGFVEGCPQRIGEDDPKEKRPSVTSGRRRPSGMW
jgi:hypothetical protein